jgi:ABC-2 type transport system ATP-binding protein
MEVMLEVKGLCKTYPSFKLDHVSFKVEQGMIMGLIGRNGAGKTTTMKSMLDLVHPDEGEVLFFGKSIKESGNAIRQRIGYASGANLFYMRKKIKDITAMTRTFYENWDDEAYQKYLKMFGLDESKKLMELSEGMKVKYSLASALSHHAQLLILDEPTSGLDPVSREELLEIFQYLAKQQTAILFSTHITTDLEKCADAITYIKKGSVIASESFQDFMKEYPDQKSLEDIMVHLERQPMQFDME